MVKTDSYYYDTNYLQKLQRSLRSPEVLTPPPPERLSTIVMYEHPLHSEPEAHNTLVVNASQVHSFRRQLTSGAIQYGVPMVVLRLPSVFSTTAEIPRVRKEGRRKGGKKERKKGEWKVRRVSTHTSFFLCSLLPLPNSHSQLTNSSHSPPHQLTPPHLTHSHTPLIT